MNSEELREWQKSLGFDSQEEAAKALHTPVRTYKSWIGGENKPPPCLDLACKYVSIIKNYGVKKNDRK